MPEPVPAKRTGIPVIQKLIIKDGAFLFDNQETKAQLELKLIQAEVAGFLQEPVKLNAEGTYQKQPMTLSLRFPALKPFSSLQQFQLVFTPSIFRLGHVLGHFSFSAHKIVELAMKNRTCCDGKQLPITRSCTSCFRPSHVPVCRPEKRIG